MRNLVAFTALIAAFLRFLGGINFALSDIASSPHPISLQSITSTPGNQIQIISPSSGSPLQGSIPVIVDTTIQDFKTVELAFKYSNDPDETWFLIYQGIQPVTGTMLVLWDTSTITDGNYTLRMTVTFNDGSQKSVEAGGLRVRNYTPVETSTPTEVSATSTPEPAATLTPTVATTIMPTMIIPTATPPATNPAQLSRFDVFTNIGKGALFVFALFALAFAYRGVRAIRRAR